MNVVIAYDGSNQAKAAIQDLRRAGLPHGGNALVVTVAEGERPAFTASLATVSQSGIAHRVAGTLVQAHAEAELAIARAEKLSREGVQRVNAHLPRWGVYAAPVVGAAAEAIVREANNWRADLTVVGSHGRTALGQLILGSVAKRVASESSRSVRVARCVVERGDAPVRVIVGVDGSPGAEAAFHAVALRPWPARTEVRLIAVDDTPRATGTVNLFPRAPDWVDESNQERLERSRAMLTSAAAALRGAGMSVSTHTPTGNPSDLITQVAAAWEADCIFVGARGLGTMHERFHTGNVSTALITRAPCSVELIRV